MNPCRHECRELEDIGVKPARSRGPVGNQMLGRHEAVGHEAVTGTKLWATKPKVGVRQTRLVAQTLTPATMWAGGVHQLLGA